MRTPGAGCRWGLLLKAIDAMGLMYLLFVDTEDGTTNVQMEANSKDEALKSCQGLYSGCKSNQDGRNFWLERTSKPSLGEGVGMMLSDRS